MKNLAFAKFTLVSIIILLLTSSCIGETALVNETAIAITPSTTPTMCPITTPTNLQWESPQQKNRLIVIFIDRSTSFSNPYSQTNYTLESLELIKDVVPQIIKPGDRVFIAWLGFMIQAQNGVIFDGKVPINELTILPRTINTPEPFSNNPMQEPTGNTVQQENIRKANATTVAENYRNTHSYYCAQIDRNNLIHEDVEFMQQEWDKNEAAILKEFIEKFDQELSAIDSTRHDDQTNISESLLLASMIFDHDHTPYDEYVLLIFSDMEDSRASLPEEYPIDLKNVDLIVGNLYCRQEKKCLEKEKEWTKLFQTLGVQSTEFLWVFETNPEHILEILNKENNHE